MSWSSSNASFNKITNMSNTETKNMEEVKSKEKEKTNKTDNLIKIGETKSVI